MWLNSYSSCSTLTNSTANFFFSPSLTVVSHSSHHQFCCPARLRKPKPKPSNTLPKAKEQGREEEVTDSTHQFCCPASNCSSPSSR
ncbi:hypothetical protein AALO_G00054290 [Alosa alosa]|uniref:Uncharacterized protein n=1 Tax=Alosa alosa TaxID=278164 RepID=A0AAV6H4U0_9TELE|nr:hypothetical protein AALO_G00054290 [Alosa alosa]